MKYIKFKLNFKEQPDRFNREILVRENLDLFELSIAFLTVLNSAFEHCFLINCENNLSYVMACFMNERCQLDNYRYLRNYSIKDLPNQFEFEYDTGDGWRFTCEKSDEIYENNSLGIIHLLDGKGQGIWEDNISSLFDYFDGLVTPDQTENDEERGIYKPWNIKIKKFGDFDSPLKINLINKTLTDLYLKNYKTILNEERKYIKEVGTNF